MTSDRPYRPALKLKEAVGRIRTGVRVQFDPRVTRAFLEVLRAEVRGEAMPPEILTGVDMRFSTAAMVGSIDRFIGELEPAGN
jgi:HD-GYP domain-containing protein (c-di-GMP phosphodiesterase class II)